MLLVAWLRDEWIDLRELDDASWPHDNVRVILWTALVLLLGMGSMVTWKSLSLPESSRVRHAFLLRLIIVIIATPFIVVTVTSEGFVVGQVINDSAKLTFGRPYKFDLNSQGSELAFSGLVTYGMANALEAQLSAHPEVRRIRLKSPGGMINAGSNAALIIRAHELDTVVSGECVSSCTIMFVAGKVRTLEPDGRLGFHGASSPVPNKSEEGVFRRAYAPFELESSFVDQVEATTPPDLWYPERSELVMAHVLSNEVLPSR